MNYQNNTEGICDAKATGSDAKNFVLWREVVMAYAAPAIMASIGGLVTADRGPAWSIRGMGDIWFTRNF
ncbi:hypothetical protein [Aneurinibacillus soli]|uniref:hypothetical protein n=1 Tax=Aneurinibacillus soli TaxID=1500254 RepID=UPI0028163CE8|nr:hypothetical protein [Aneurinibacillus soli]